MRMQIQPMMQHAAITPYAFDWSFVDAIDPYLLKFKRDTKLMKALASQIAKAPFAPIESPQRAQRVFQISQVLIESSLELNEKCLSTIRELKAEVAKLKNEISDLQAEPKGVIGNRCPCCLKAFETLEYLDVHFFSKHSQLAVLWNIIRQPQSIAMNSTQLAATLEPFVQHEADSDLPSLLRQWRSQLQAEQQLSEQKMLGLISEKMSTFENKVDELQSTLKRDDTMTQPVRDSCDEISDILPQRHRRKSSPRRDMLEPRKKASARKQWSDSTEEESDSDYFEVKPKREVRKPKLRVVPHEATEIFPEDGPIRIESPKPVVQRTWNAPVRNSQPLPKRVGKEKLIEIIRQRLAKRKEEKEREAQNQKEATPKSQPSSSSDDKRPVAMGHSPTVRTNPRVEKMKIQPKPLNEKVTHGSEESMLPTQEAKQEVKPEIAVQATPEVVSKQDVGVFKPEMSDTAEKSSSSNAMALENESSDWDKKSQAQPATTRQLTDSDMSMEDILLQAEREAALENAGTSQGFVSDNEEEDPRSMLSVPQSHEGFSSGTREGFKITSGNGQTSNVTGNETDSEAFGSDHATFKFPVPNQSSQTTPKFVQSQESFDVPSSPWISEEQLTADSEEKGQQKSGSDVGVETFSSDLSDKQPAHFDTVDGVISEEQDGSDAPLSLNELAMPVTPVLGRPRVLLDWGKTGKD